MKHLTRKNLARHLKKRKRIFIFLDYDGTLAPIVKNPQLAKISPETKNILYQLSGKKGFLIGIISGRSLKDIKTRIGLPGIVYAGNHGLEMYFKGRKIVATRLCRQRLRPLPRKPVKKCLKESLKDIPGVIFEDKGPILALHYRKVAEKDQAKVVKIFKNAVKPFLKQKAFRIGRGKKVLELRPAFSFNKAEAVDFFQKKFKKGKNDLVIFIGDDITDEDVFKSLKSPDIGIRVGKSKSSKAAYFINNTREVTSRLADLANCITD